MKDQNKGIIVNHDIFAKRRHEQNLLKMISVLLEN